MNFLTFNVRMLTKGQLLAAARKATFRNERCAIKNELLERGETSEVITVGAIIPDENNNWFYEEDWRNDILGGFTEKSFLNIATATCAFDNVPCDIDVNHIVGAADAKYVDAMLVMIKQDPEKFDRYTFDIYIPNTFRRHAFLYFNGNSWTTLNNERCGFDGFTIQLVTILSMLSGKQEVLELPKCLDEIKQIVEPAFAEQYHI
jgi:hypothetical protein